VKITNNVYIVFVDNFSTGRNPSLNSNWRCKLSGTTCYQQDC